MPAQRVTTVESSGIRQVNQLIAEACNYFHGLAVNPSWEWEDVPVDYGAPVNSDFESKIP